MVIERWTRYEAESYLVHPTALSRFVESRTLPLMAPASTKYLEDQLPPAVYRKPLVDHDFWNATPASKTILPGFFDAVDIRISKNEYYLIAEQMLPEEIPDEVKRKLDAVAKTFDI